MLHGPARLQAAVAGWRCAAPPWRADCLAHRFLAVVALADAVEQLAAPAGYAVQHYCFSWGGAMPCWANRGMIHHGIWRWAATEDGGVPPTNPPAVLHHDVGVLRVLIRLLQGHHVQRATQLPQDGHLQECRGQAGGAGEGGRLPCGVDLQGCAPHLPLDGVQELLLLGARQVGDVQLLLDGPARACWVGLGAGS